jgi:hypothetical protein
MGQILVVDREPISLRSPLGELQTEQILPIQTQPIPVPALLAVAERAAREQTDSGILGISPSCRSSCDRATVVLCHISGRESAQVPYRCPNREEDGAGKIERSQTLYCIIVQFTTVTQ